MADYKFNGHIAKIAESDFGGFFGWANLTLRNSGGYMRMTAGPGPADMRVIDMYRAQDAKLAENWIFIDMLHYLAMQGLDVLAHGRRAVGRRLIAEKGRESPVRAMDTGDGSIRMRAVQQHRI